MTKHTFFLNHLQALKMVSLLLVFIILAMESMFG